MLYCLALPTRVRDGAPRLATPLTFFTNLRPWRKLW